VRTGLDLDDLGADLHATGGQRAEVLEQHRLEVVLRGAGRGRGTDDCALCARRQTQRDRAARRHERLADPAHPFDVEAARADLLLESPRAQELHRPRAHCGGARQRGELAPALHKKRLDAVAGERDRRRQSCRAGPDDQHGDLFDARLHSHFLLVGQYVFHQTVCLWDYEVSSRIARMPTRRYEQRLRAEAAEETRRRILDAVEQRLRETPSQPVSVDRVARDARVARSTVYLVFGSRAGLFDAFAANLFEHGGFDRVVEAVRHPDAREHLRGGIRGGVETFAAHREVLRALWSMATLDPGAVGGAVQRSEQRRARGMARLARRLAEQGVLRPDVTVDEAAHLLWVLTSFDGFDLLYTGRGLSTDEVSRVLITTAERSLCR
jgi:AcrR family transcriptional regulator